MTAVIVLMISSRGDNFPDEAVKRSRKVDERRFISLTLISPFSYMQMKLFYSLMTLGLVSSALGGGPKTFNEDCNQNNNSFCCCKFQGADDSSYCIMEFETGTDTVAGYTCKNSGYVFADYELGEVALGQWETLISPGDNCGLCQEATA